jgi:hypothetical protein
MSTYLVCSLWFYCAFVIFAICSSALCHICNMFQCPSSYLQYVPVPFVIFTVCSSALCHICSMFQCPLSYLQYVPVPFVIFALGSSALSVPSFQFQSFSSVVLSYSQTPSSTVRRNSTSVQNNDWNYCFVSIFQFSWFSVRDGETKHSELNCCKAFRKLNLLLIREASRSPWTSSCAMWRHVPSSGPRPEDGCSRFLRNVDA